MGHPVSWGNIISSQRINKSDIWYTFKQTASYSDNKPINWFHLLLSKQIREYSLNFGNYNIIII